MQAQKRSVASRKKVNGGAVAAAASAESGLPGLSNFKGLLGEAEALIKATTDFSADAVATARAQFGKKLEQAKQAFTDAEAMAKQSYEKSIQLSEQYVKENPWQIVAAAVALGFIVGKLSAKSKA